MPCCQHSILVSKSLLIYVRYYTSINNGSNYYDGFVSKLDNGLTSLLASTYLGGSNSDHPRSVTKDSGGNIYVHGMTYSSDFPVTTGVYDTSFNGGVFDSFISKFNGTLASLLASTYLGGSGKEYSQYHGPSLAIDTSGNILVTGTTYSSDFPTTTGVYDTSLGGDRDAYVSKISGDLTNLLASTYLGGSIYDEGYSIAGDSSGNIYVVGYTYSSDFPTTTGAYDTSYNSGVDAFVSKFNGSLTGLLASTYLGGSNADEANALVIDSSSNIYIAGYTDSSEFPTTASAYDTSRGGATDAFISKFNGALTSTSLLASTYLGGSGIGDVCYSLAIDSVGNIYATGYTKSSDFPTTTGAYDTSYNDSSGSYDAFIAKLDSNLSAASPPTVTTISATSVTSSSATLKGTVNANGQSTTAWFNYGITSGTYTGTTTTQSVSGSSNTSVSSDISGLSSNTKYYYRIAASNSAGTAYGSEVSFTTPTPDNKPLGSVSINSGTSYTNSTAVTLTLTATDDVGVVGYYVSINSSTPIASASGWNFVTSTTSYTGSASYTLTSGDEQKTVYVWYKDAAGNVSSTASDSIILDTTAPIVTITNSEVISLLSLSGSTSDSSSGVKEVTWSNSGGGSGAASGTTNWSISNIILSCGDNVITVTATDNAGNTGTDTFAVSIDCPTIFPTPTPSPTITPILGVIVGTVVDALTTAPISGATVVTNGYSGTTGPDGSYVIPDVPAGDYTLTAAATGYTSLSQTVTVVGDVTVLANFALLPALPTPLPTPGGGMVFGFVYDEDDSPLPGVTVTIESNSFSKSAETDEDGYYLFDGLGAGNYKLTYEKEGYKTQTQDINLEQDEVKDLGTITLVRVEPPKIYGYVVNIKGSPIEFVRLKLKGIKTKVKKTASSDADGFFEFTDLEADNYIIFAKKKRYRNTQRKVKLGDSESKEIEIVMKKTSKRVKEMIEDSQE